MTTYVTSVGGDPINPNPFTYSQISMTASIVLVWPSNTEDATYTATDWIDITANNSGYTVDLPAANQAGEGAEVVFNNYGAYTITVDDADGGNITSVAAGETKRVWVTDNSDAAGSWRVANIGSGTTEADASALAGYGLVAQAGLLSQSMPSATYSTSATINAGVRSYLVKWTGGAGTFTLTNPVTLGSNWFCNFNNAGSGTLTLDGNGVNIDSQSTVSVSPGEGFTVVTDGTKFYTLGKPSPFTNSYTLLTKSVAGSTDVTLTAGEAAYSIIYFTGILTGNINVIVPAAVNQWIMYNNTSGSFTLTVKTASGTGVAVTQGTRRILNCDGTNVTFSDAVGTGTVTSIVTGTGLSGGPITTTGTITLANTAVAAGSYGGSSGIPSFTADAQGRLTAAANATTATMGVGAAATPSYTFTGDTDNGMYLPAANTVGVAANGANVLTFTNPASAVNYLTSSGNIAGSAPIVSVAGSDTNVGATIYTKGTGTFSLYSHSGTIQMATFNTQASAVNYLNFHNNTTGNNPYMQALGSDTNVGMNFYSQGTGPFNFYSNASATQQFSIINTASSVNWMTVTGSSTGNETRLNVTGSDTNVGIVYSTKGTGSHRFFINNIGTEAFRVYGDTNVAVGTGSIATTATAGFFWIPSSAGAPTGAPTPPQSNLVAMHYDRTNNRIYVYNGGWKMVGLT